MIVRNFFLMICSAFDAAQQMLIDGEKPERSNTKQVIYYMTDGDPSVFSTLGFSLFNNFHRFENFSFIHLGSSILPPSMCSSSTEPSLLMVSF